MLTGLQLFQSFDERLRRAEREAGAAQAEVDRALRRVGELRAAEAEAVQGLARLRLAMLGEGGGAALGELDAASAQARGLLAERNAALDAARAEVAARRRAVEEAEARRDEEAARLREAEEAAARAAEAARSRLEADPEWRRLRDAAEAAARVAQHAAQKAAYARRDREEKGRPYLGDPLFRYLWERGYGTARYRAGPFTRMMDGFVARVARYEPNRRAFALLDELPERLAEHASRMEEAARESAGALMAQEQRVAPAPPPPDRTALTRAEEALQQAHAALGEAERRRAILAAGEDEKTKRAAMVLEFALAQQSLVQLREAASRTPTPQDDGLVTRLERVAADRTRLERDIAGLRDQAAVAHRRVEELLSLRQEMRERGYDRAAWRMGDAALLGMLVGQVLSGALRRGTFWDRMEEYRVPDWGSSPGGWDSSPWGGQHGGGSPSGGFETGGGFGGNDSFRTGGSFGGGGGGFRTGGSF
jgi:uncharacterized membrane protein YgcG